MKHAAIGLIVAAFAATSPFAVAQDGGAAGTVEKAASFADGNVATIGAIGVGALTGIVVYVVGASDGSPSTATATSTAPTSTAQ